MSRPKIYTIEEEYFNTPLDERKAYFLGLILSDGHLNYKKGVFQYSCKKDDVEILEFIKKELNSSHPIKEYKIKNKWYVRYNITNKKLVTSIIDNYKLPKSNKSLNNLTIPTKLKNEYLSHFLRGMFDGDGSIWKSDNFCFSYTGGYNMMNEIKTHLFDVGIETSPIKFRYGKENKNSCSFGTKGTLKVNTFGKYLYNHSTCFLKRKYDKFKECEIVANKTNDRLFKLNGVENKIKNLYLSGKSQKEISNELNLIYSSVRCCIQRMRKNKEII